MEISKTKVKEEPCDSTVAEMDSPVLLSRGQQLIGNALAGRELTNADGVSSAQTSAENTMERLIAYKWTHEYDSMLIRFYRENPCLWQPSHESYFNKHLKIKLFDEFIREMKIQYHKIVEVNDLKSKWRNLRTSYLREKKKESSNMKSRYDDEPYRSRWIHFKELDFLSVSLSQTGSGCFQLQQPAENQSNWFENFDFEDTSSTTSEKSFSESVPVPANDMNITHQPSKADLVNVNLLGYIHVPVPSCVGVAPPSEVVQNDEHQDEVILPDVPESASTHHLTIKTEKEDAETNYNIDSIFTNRISESHVPLNVSSSDHTLMESEPSHSLNKENHNLSPVIQIDELNEVQNVDNETNSLATLKLGGKRTYRCSRCSLGFPTMERKKLHELRSHKTSQTKQLCSYCGKAMGSFLQKLLHERSHELTDKKIDRKKRLKKWNVDSEEMLICFIRDNQFLWDSRHTDYCNKPKRQRALEHFCNVLKIQEHGEFQVEDVKIKWKNLRSAYGRERKKEDTRSKEGFVTGYRSRWCHYDDMKYLDALAEKTLQDSSLDATPTSNTEALELHQPETVNLEEAQQETPRESLLVSMLKSRPVVQEESSSLAVLEPHIEVSERLPSTASVESRPTSCGTLPSVTMDNLINGMHLVQKAKKQKTNEVDEARLKFFSSAMEMMARLEEQGKNQNVCDDLENFGMYVTAVLRKLNLCEQEELKLEMQTVITNYMKRKEALRR